MVCDGVEVAVVFEEEEEEEEVVVVEVVVLVPVYVHASAGDVWPIIPIWGM